MEGEEEGEKGGYYYDAGCDLVGVEGSGECINSFISITLHYYKGLKEQWRKASFYSTILL